MPTLRRSNECLHDPTPAAHHHVPCIGGDTKNANENIHFSRVPLPQNGLQSTRML